MKITKIWVLWCLKAPLRVEFRLVWIQKDNFMQPKLKLFKGKLRQRSHYAGEIWKRSFISMVRPTVHTNSSRKRSFSQTLFESKGFDRTGFLSPSRSVDGTSSKGKSPGNDVAQYQYMCFLTTGWGSYSSSSRHCIWLSAAGNAERRQGEKKYLKMSVLILALILGEVNTMGIYLLVGGGLKRFKETVRRSNLGKTFLNWAGSLDGCIYWKKTILIKLFQLYPGDIPDGRRLPFNP